MLQIRHCFNEYLERYGGLIAYSVAPGERRKGYATLMLSMPLPKCKELELDRVLFTMPNGHLSCDNPSLSPEDTDSVEKLLFPIFGEDMKREHIMAAYDNWSGVFIMQNVGFDTGDPDRVIERIAEYLGSIKR